MTEQRIFYCTWQHKDDEQPLSHILLYPDSANLLYHFSTYHTDLIFFAFEDITDKNIKDFERKITSNGKYEL